MTLRNSYLVRLIENGKRRAWLLVVSVLLFIVALPIYTAMEISIVKGLEESIGYAQMQKQLYSHMQQILEFNFSMAFFGGCFAVLSGMQGFSYLYDRSKIDFYCSKPVKASQRFFTIWLNGVLMYAVPFIVGSILNVLLVAASGILDITLISSFGKAIILSLASYLSFYSIVILAVMLTGKPLITLMGICVFLFYEMVIRATVASLSSFSFHFYYGYGRDDWYRPLLSPFYMLERYWDEEIGLLTAVVLFLLFAVAVLALAYWCYKKRPSELAGSAMTFHGIKPVIKIGISVPVALLAGLATAGLMNYSPLDGSGSPFFPILLGALFVILSNALIQVIFEADIRGMIHKKSHIVISAVLTLIIMLVFRYDLTGYDNRIPKLDKIESVSIVTESSGRYTRSFYDADMKQLDKEEYVDKYMQLTGEDAENVRKLALYSIERYQEYPNREAFWESGEDYAYVSYKFRLKNGKTIVREIPVFLRDETAREYIAAIERSEDFMRYNEPVMSEYFLAAIENGDYKIDATWGNDIQEEKLTASQVKELVNLYQKDLLNDSYETKCRELPIGRIRIYLDMQISYNREMDLTVYPSFRNAVTYLKNNGFETEKYVDTDIIDRIVIYKHYDSEEKMLLEDTTVFAESAVAYEVDRFTKSSDYVDAAKIAEIVDNSCPDGLEYDYWYQEYPYDDANYQIAVYFKEDSSAFDEYGSVGNFYFLKDQVPQFVLEDLPKEWKEDLE